jgi:phytanoyl-CoA hydroxylase
MHLTDWQVSFFRHQGFLKLGTPIDPNLSAALTARLRRDFAVPTPPFRRDSQGRVIRLDALLQRAPVYSEVLWDPTLSETLKSLLGPNVEVTLNRHNHATTNPPRANIPRLHRDVLQWSRGLITALIYLEDAGTENGCTYLIPGSHFLPFVGQPNNGGTWMDEHAIYKGLIGQALPVPVRMGEVLIFDSLIFHTVGANTSRHDRLTICLGFHSVDELTPEASARSRLVLGEKLYRGNDLPL